MKKTWLETIDDARKDGTRGFVLTGNTEDRFFDGESEYPFVPLRQRVAAHLYGQGYAVASFSLAAGFEPLDPPGKPAIADGFFKALPDKPSPVDVLRQMTRWLRQIKQPVALILDYADHLATNSSGMTSALSEQQRVTLETIHSWGLDENIRRTPNLIFLISYTNEVSDLLLRSGVGYKQVDIPLPSESERHAFVERLVKRRQEQRGEPLPTDLEPGEFARLTSGLPYVEIEKFFKYSTETGAAIDHHQIRERKASVIRQLCHGLLEVHETKGGFDGVSGLDHAKQELSRIVDTIRRNPLNAPQAMLLIGVPGCGKSWIVRAVAHELGFPCLAMRNLREGLVGAAERNLERVLLTIENLAPCVLWVDEIDQMMGRRNTGQTMDAGVNERMTGRLWEFMGSMEHRGRILWIGTSNRPDTLDAAYLDRFAVRIPFLHPTSQEVCALLPALARQLGRTLADDVHGEEIATLESLSMPTVRGLQEVIARAAALTDEDGGAPGTAIDHAHILEAAQDFRRNYNPIHHELIALKSIEMTSFSSTLPWRTRAGLRPGYVIPSYLVDLVRPDSGLVDDALLTERIQSLTRAAQQDEQGRRF